ncbi:MAG: hypothetical protein JNL05_06535 [Flavobacteriales bacterium]|nr:hypothetical protein [Flavobacteriales bacterium]
MRKTVLLLLLVVAAVVGCTRDVLEEPSTTEGGPRAVSFVLDSVPYATLSAYNFFTGDLARLEPAAGVLPYEPITPLFSDHAHKKRFIWMPDSVHATYVNDSTVLDFPEGTVFIKSFYYDKVQPFNTRRILETRLLYRRDGEWHFADYIWNEEQTEATFSLSGAYRSVVFMNEDDEPRCVTFRIPSASECHTCHKYYDDNIPIGPEPQNLNSVYPYPDGPMNQLAKWEQVGYLAPGYPASINTVVDWRDATQSLNDRVRAYLDMNCAHCHSTGRHCDYRPMRFAWNETTDPTALGICVAPEDPIDPAQTHIVAAGNRNRSMLYYRLSSVEPAVRMPLMGRTVVHEEALDLIGQWIDSLGPPCP